MRKFYLCSQAQKCVGRVPFTGKASRHYGVLTSVYLPARKLHTIISDVLSETHTHTHTCTCTHPNLYQGSLNNVSMLEFKVQSCLNVICFLLGNSPASEFCIPTFRNTLFRIHRRVGIILHAYLPMNTEQSVPKSWRIKFRRRGITQKEAYNLSINYCVLVIF